MLDRLWERVTACKIACKLEVINWYCGSDYGEIGLKRFLPDLPPLLNARRHEKRVQAAREILPLFERGR